MVDPSPLSPCPTPKYSALLQFLDKILSYVPNLDYFATITQLSMTCVLYYNVVQNYALRRRMQILKELQCEIGMDFVKVTRGTYLVGDKHETLMHCALNYGEQYEHDAINWDGEIDDDGAAMWDGEVLFTREGVCPPVPQAKGIPPRVRGALLRSDEHSSSTESLPSINIDIPYELLGKQTGSPSVLTRSQNAQNPIRPEFHQEPIQKTPRRTLHLPNDVYIAKNLLTHSQWDKIRRRYKNRLRNSNNDQLIISVRDEDLSRCNLIQPYMVNVRKDQLCREKGDEPLEVTYKTASKLALVLEGTLPTWSIWECAASADHDRASNYPWGDDVSKHFEFGSLIEEIHYGYEETRNVIVDVEESAATRSTTEGRSDSQPQQMIIQQPTWKKGTVHRLRDEPSSQVASAAYDLQDLMRFGKEFNMLDQEHQNHPLCILRSLSALHQSTSIPPPHVSPAQVQNFDKMATSEHRAYSRNPLSLHHYMLSSNVALVRAGFRLMFVDGVGGQSAPLPLRQCSHCQNLTFHPKLCDSCHVGNGTTERQVYLLIGQPLSAAIDHFGPPSAVKHQSSQHTNNISSYLLYTDRGIYVKSTQADELEKQCVQSITFLPAGSVRWGMKFTRPYPKSVCDVSLNMSRNTLLDDHRLELRAPTVFEGASFERDVVFPEDGVDVHMKVVLHRGRNEGHIKYITLTNNRFWKGSSSNPNLMISSEQEESNESQEFGEEGEQSMDQVTSSSDAEPLPPKAFGFGKRTLSLGSTKRSRSRSLVHALAKKTSLVTGASQKSTPGATIKSLLRIKTDRKKKKSKLRQTLHSIDAGDFKPMPPALTRKRSNSMLVPHLSSQTKEEVSPVSPLSNHLIQRASGGNKGSAESPGQKSPKTPRSRRSRSRGVRNQPAVHDFQLSPNSNQPFTLPSLTPPSPRHRRNSLIPSEESNSGEEDAGSVDPREARERKHHSVQLPTLQPNRRHLYE